MRPAPGLLINPNIRLLEPLGSGAMGAVWVAEHLTLHTRVAVKVISERLDPDDQEVLARFSREATTAAQIKSSHVVQTFDHGVTSDGTPYIVMELLDGESLGQRLDRHGALPLDLCGQIVLQAAKALHSAHKLGIVHRDIKPDNLFLSSRDDELNVLILDFGIAKQTLLPAMGGITCEDMMVGTPEYMSPEQVMSSREADHTADVWALSVVAYACVTGTLPFFGEAIGQLCINLLKGEFVAPRLLRPELPIGIDRFFERAFARDKQARFPGARELAAAFLLAVPNAALPRDALVTGRFTPLDGESLTSGDAGSSRPPSDHSATMSASTAPLQRRRSAVWGLGALGALAAFAATLFYLAAHGAEPRAARSFAAPPQAIPVVRPAPPPAPFPLAQPSAAPAAPMPIRSPARRPRPPAAAPASAVRAARNPGF